MKKSLDFIFLNMKSKLFYFLLHITGIIFSQNYLDSLKTIITSDLSDSIKEQRINSFFKESSLKRDSIAYADYYHELGKFYHKLSKKGKRVINLEKAILYSKKSLNLKREKNAPDISIKKTLYNLGFFHWETLNYFEAINSFQQIIDMHKVDKKTLGALRTISKIYFEIGDYHKALLSLNDLIDISTGKEKYVSRNIQAHILRAEICLSMDSNTHNERIREDLKKADSLITKYDLSGSRYDLRSSQLEGNRLLENGFYKDAIPYFEKVLTGLSSKDSENLAKVNNSLGNCFFKLGKNNKAIAYLKKAVLYDADYSLSYENLGDVFLDNQKFEEALLYYQEGINAQLFDITLEVTDKVLLEHLEQSKEKYYLLLHLIQKAKAWISYYHFEKDLQKLSYALQTFETADKLIDIIRFESTEYKSKLYWRERGASLYKGAVEVCYLLNQPEKAFYFMEKNKAILLLEDISNHQAMKSANIPIEKAQKEGELKRKIHSIQNELLLSTSKEAVKKELYFAKREYAEFIDSLTNVYPSYASYKRSLPILSYKNAISKFISANTNVLQYIIGPNDGFGLFINEDKPVFFKIPKTEELLEEVKEYNDFVSQKITSKEDYQKLMTNANVIFNKIIPEKVYQKLKGEKVIIIPDYYLQEVSFETLATTSKFNSFLLKDVEINYAYSLSYLDSNNSLIRGRTKNFLGIAPVNFDNLNLPKLNYTLSEVNKGKDIFLGESFLEEEATKKNFLKNASNYNILHFATHAEVNQASIPWIAMSDGKLSLEEIYGYKNQHEIVTLSACETSLGKMQQGEGVLSLARGFFYGGAKSVVSSLWATNDKANQKIVIDFYKELKKGSSKSFALRQAKLNYLNTHEGIEALPFYWGGLILTGDSGAIEFHNNFFKSPLFLVCFSVLLISIFLLVIFRFKSFQK